MTNQTTASNQKVQTAAAQPSKAQQVAQVKKINKHKGRWRKIMYWLIPLALVLGIIFYILWLLAMTGLVYVPVISNLFYEDPVPLRQVAVGTPLEQTLAKQVEDEVVSRVQKTKGDLDNREIKIVINEGDLTASLRPLLVQSAVENIDPSGAVATISSGNIIELYVPVSSQHRRSAVRLRMRAEATNGLLELTTEEFIIGQLKMPKFINKRYIDPEIIRSTSLFNHSVGRFVSMDAVTSTERQLKIDGTITVKIFEVD